MTMRDIERQMLRDMHAEEDQAAQDDLRQAAERVYCGSRAAHEAHDTCGGSTVDMPSRRFDRAPETESDTRFFDLRESGYDGWIDQDGYATTGPTWLDSDGNPVRGFGPADCEYVDES
jgi:hypothetical protein